MLSMRPDQKGHLLELGAELRALRFKRGLTLREAARLISSEHEDGALSFQMLGQIEKDGQATTTEKLDAIVRTLGGRVRIEDDATRALPVSVSPERAALVDRFLAVLPYVPDEALEVFAIELRLWHARYMPKDG